MTLSDDDRPIWSRSQVETLRSCARKHALSRQAKHLGEETGRLSQVKNRFLWTGSLVHESVKELLLLVRQGSSLPDKDDFLNSVREKMRDQFRASREGSGVRLFEHEYAMALSPDAWRRQWTTIESGLRWFFDSKWLKRLTALGPECWKAVDEILSFDVNGIKAYVKIDCAIESAGRVCVIDWKTSTPKPSSEFPLRVAALYAHEMWGAEPDRIDAVAVSLGSGTTYHATIDEETLMETHLRIEEESGLLAEAMADGTADPLTLPMTENPDACRACSYQRLCFPAAVSLNAVLAAPSAVSAK